VTTAKDILETIALPRCEKQGEGEVLLDSEAARIYTTPPASKGMSLRSECLAKLMLKHINFDELTK
jgi:hypothetical protein